MKKPFINIIDAINDLSDKAFSDKKILPSKEYLDAKKGFSESSKKVDDNLLKIERKFI